MVVDIAVQSCQCRTGVLQNAEESPRDLDISGRVSQWHARILECLRRLVPLMITMQRGSSGGSRQKLRAGER